MDIKGYEIELKKGITDVLLKILGNHPKMNIDVKKGERVGDAITKFLENKFVDYTKTHTHFKNSESSPSGKTKHPWDAQTFFNFKGHSEMIWIDFKAVNTHNDNSNPDSGTPNKVFELMLKHDSFYLLYVVIYYKGLGNGLGLEFDMKDEIMVKPILLKDVEKNMHITPSNQIQFNVFAKEEYRTRTEFIQFFKTKLIESNLRRIEDAKEKFDLINQGKYRVPKTIYEKEEFDFSILDEINKLQEEKINKL